MTNILLIETSTRVCSVGVAQNGQLISLFEDQSANYSHSALLTGFVASALRHAGLATTDLTAVAVSMGPGSYTGLRIGVSASKGFCYALNLPLIAVDTLRAMAGHCLDMKKEWIENMDNDKANLLLCPMIDARRMEVYMAIFDHQLKNVEPTQARIIGEDSFSEMLAHNRMIFFGDGAQKCASVLQHQNASVLNDVFPSAKGMVAMAFEQFLARQFVDVAYFEPFYLKDFIAGKPKVKGLNI